MVPALFSAYRLDARYRYLTLKYINNPLKEAVQRPPESARVVYANRRKPRLCWGKCESMSHGSQFLPRRLLKNRLFLAGNNVFGISFAVPAAGLLPPRPAHRPQYLLRAPPAKQAVDIALKSMAPVRPFAVGAGQVGRHGLSRQIVELRMTSFPFASARPKIGNIKRALRPTDRA